MRVSSFVSRNATLTVSTLFAIPSLLVITTGGGAVSISLVLGSSNERFTVRSTGPPLPFSCGFCDTPLLYLTNVDASIGFPASATLKLFSDGDCALTGFPYVLLLISSAANAASLPCAPTLEHLI
jgi:hypothetical protein